MTDNNKIVAVACALGALVAASPAYAQSVEANSVRVSYGDLNLESRAGADRLIQRLETAARQVCNDSSGRMTLQEHLRVRKCKASVMEQAVADLGHANVSTRFASLGGGVQPVLYASR